MKIKNALYTILSLIITLGLGLCMLLRLKKKGK